MAEDDYYTVVFHHGGVLVSEPHMEYIGGVVDSWANVDIDQVKDGLRPLENDTDVRMLYSIVHEKAQNKEIHFYFEHEDEVEVIDGDSEDDDCGDSEDDVYKPRHEDEGGDSEDNEDDADDEDHEDDEDEIVVDIGSGTVGCSGNPMPKSKKPKKQKWRACNGRPRYPNIEDVQRPHEARNTVDDADDEGGYHSDQMGSIRGDSDDEGRYEIKPPQFNEAAPFGQVDLQLYMLFPTLKMLKQAVKDYTIALGRPVKQVKADKGRCKYTCEQGLDGCFLKGYYGGTLLVAVSQDGNHSFYVIAYVIAYAIIGQETKDTWSWFLTRLFEDIGHPKDVGCEFISDMQKYYSMETWENMYRPYIHPVRGSNQWEQNGDNPIQPPKYCKGGGRPKKKRNRANDMPDNPFKAKRKLKTFTCRKCGEQGHNSRLCKGTVEKERPSKKAKTYAKDKVTRPEDVPLFIPTLTISNQVQIRQQLRSPFQQPNPSPQPPVQHGPPTITPAPFDIKGQNRVTSESVQPSTKVTRAMSKKMASSPNSNNQS
ncbi:hypothetical protein CRG98_033835 [Punica granatum]|uniref:CCHC-type domain-containing protein n=1 Tax=Punica granatum TaxID=22663 RepID=A0A2I0IP99_PUNGR|nr:hypothetical protein CRG98_033835 [Punica granatum]